MNHFTIYDTTPETRTPITRTMKLIVSDKITVEEFCDKYIEQYAKPHKKTWKLDEGRCRLYLKPEWGNRFIDTITREDTAALHAKIGKTKPYEANRVRELVSAMWTLADDWELVPNGHRNPGKRIKEFREVSRARYLDSEEVKRLFDALLPEKYPVRIAITLMILTGMRRGEVLNLKWTDVNLERGEIYLPETKSGRPHLIPMSPLVWRILKDAPKDSSFVVEGRKNGRPKYDLQGPWERIRKRAELQDVRMHDLRRTVGSWLAQDGFSLHVIGGVLNQSSARVTEVYARLNTAPLQVALNHQSRIIEDLIGSPVQSKSSMTEGSFVPARKLESIDKPISVSLLDLQITARRLRLTKRQKEVFYLFMNGCSTTEISEKLGTGLSNISYHLMKLRQVLEVEDPQPGSATSPWDIARKIRAMREEDTFAPLPGL